MSSPTLTSTLSFGHDDYRNFVKIYFSVYNEKMTSYFLSSKNYNLTILIKFNIIKTLRCLFYGLRLSWDFVFFVTNSLLYLSTFIFETWGREENLFVALLLFLAFHSNLRNSSNPRLYYSMVWDNLELKNIGFDTIFPLI